MFVAKTERRCGSPAERFAGKWCLEGECWAWTAGKNTKGYGHFKWATGDVRQAHRASWEIHNGPVPEGQQVLHKCDNPACVNPDHLFLGTNDDNVADRVAKGRSARLAGEKNPRAKLTADQVTVIRSSSAPLSALAKEYGVSIAAAGYARRGDHWKNI